MNNRTLSTIWMIAWGVLAVSVIVASAWGARIMVGVLVGGVWNLASLWCLGRLLGSWLSPHPSTRRAVVWPHHLSGSAGGRPAHVPHNQKDSSHVSQPLASRQVVGWLLLKFPLLYLLAFGLLRSPRVSLIGFSVGFTIVLLAVVGWFAMRSHRFINFAKQN